MIAAEGLASRPTRSRSAITSAWFIRSFGALKGFLDVRYGTRDGAACAEFSWEGNNENDPASGRGWVVLGTAGRLVGHFYIHNGDDLGFVCDRA